MKALQMCNYYSNQKSVEELGVQYQPIDKAIEDAVHISLKILLKIIKPALKSWFYQVIL